jgi:hypothetical protein
MTFDQSQDAFRGHKTFEAAAAYLDNASHYKADNAIGDDAFFNAVGDQAGCRRPTNAWRASKRLEQTPLSGASSPRGCVASSNHPLPD